MSMIALKLTDVPPYLQKGDFYRNLNEDDAEATFQIPADCFETCCDQVRDLTKLAQLLRVMMFWALDDIPQAIIEYCDDNDSAVWRDTVSDVLEEESPIFGDLIAAFGGRENTLSDIIAIGRYEISIYVFNKSDKSEETCAGATAQAAGVGDLKLLIFLHENNVEWDSLTRAFDVTKDHVHCLQYPHENDYVWEWDVGVYHSAAQHGHVQCIRYAYEQGLPFHPNVCIYAAYHGQLACLRYAHTHGCPLEANVLIAAAQEGRIDCLLYALQHGCAITKEASNGACLYNHKECLLLLRELGAVWDSELSAIAAYRPDSDCLKFLHENGCPWDDNVLHNALHVGCVETLQYAMEQGVPFDDSLLNTAVCGSSVECLKYIVEVQLAHVDEITFLLALLRGHLDMVKYLISIDCPFRTTVFASSDAQMEVYDSMFIRDNHEFVECVRYAVESGWLVGPSGIDYICSRGGEECRLVLL